MITITARNFKITDGLESAIVDKLTRFEKMIKKEDYIEVVLESKTYGQKIEVFFRINGKLVKAESIDDDLYVAIDLVVEKLKRQIDKYSNRINDTSNSIRFNDFDNNVVEEKIDEAKIVKRKFVSAKPMLEEEAILQMELLGHQSFMFFNADIEATCMIYKRHDGNYGIIVEG